MRLVLALSLAPVLASAQSPAMPQSYDSVFDQLKSLAPVRSSVAVVRGLTLRRDVMTLKLDSGLAYLLTPVAGRTIGIAFVGSGSITFAPPLGIEQFNLKRTLGDSTITGPIAAAVFIFADSTGAELGRSLTFGIAPGGSPGPDPGGAISDALDYLLDGRSRSADASLLGALLNQNTTGYFSAYIQRRRGESVMIRYDPLDAEEVTLYRRGKMVGQRVETVSQFQRVQDLVSGVQVADEQPEPLVTGSYDIDATIDPNYKFSARATLRLIGRRDQQGWAPLYLYSELDVDSVTSKGQALTYYRRNNQSALWVRFPTPVGPGDTVDVRIVYHGGVIGFGSALDAFLPSFASPIRREMTPLMDKWAFIKATETWYPRYSFEQSAAVNLTFHTPKDRKLASIGRLVDSRTEGNVTTTHWVSELPTNSVSFNIGEFDELEIKDPRIPPGLPELQPAGAERGLRHRQQPVVLHPDVRSAALSSLLRDGDPLLPRTGVPRNDSPVVDDVRRRVGGGGGRKFPCARNGPSVVGHRRRSRELSRCVALGGILRVRRALVHADDSARQ